MICFERRACECPALLFLRTYSLTPCSHAIDTSYAKAHYELIRTYIEYRRFDSDSVLRMIEKPDSILKVIEGMM